MKSEFLLAMTLAVIALPLSAVELSNGMRAAPHDLAEVDSFRWYIVEFSTSPDADVCRPDDFSALMQAFSAAGKMQNDVKMDFHQEGGASGVFLFRLYLHQTLFRANDSMTQACLTNFRAGTRMF